MRFKSPIWYPIALVLSVANLVAVGFAAGEAQAWHAAVHAALGMGFGLWAERLRQRRGVRDLQAPPEVLEALDAIEAEVGALRQELSETQERMDFTERLLAREPQARRMDPEG